MKKILTFSASVLLLLFLFACSLSDVKKAIGSPTIALKSMAIESIDLEGITFKSDYTITNPYPVAFSIQEVAADVIYESKTFTSLKSSNGVSVASLGSKTNSFTFKVPYDTILNYAKSTSGKTSLPFTLKGSASLDLSKLSLGSLSLPFTKEFSVPVFKPSFSISDVTVERPTLESLKTAFQNSGFNVIKAASLAAAVIAGKSISETDLAKINLNMGLKFNLNVANAGGAPWKFLVNSCSLNNSKGALANVNPVGSNSITSASGTIPMAATLNTANAAGFIVQLLTKSGENPKFVLDSGLSFTELNYAPNLPLAYSKEIPLKSIK